MKAVGRVVAGLSLICGTAVDAFVAAVSVDVDSDWRVEAIFSIGRAAAEDAVGVSLVVDVDAAWTVAALAVTRGAAVDAGVHCPGSH